MKKLLWRGAIFLICIILFIIAGCAPRGTISFTGTVTWVELEGGFFGIIADDGKRYEPINLPEQYAQEGVQVTVTASIREDYASIYMWGTIIEILSIEPSVSGES